MATYPKIAVVTGANQGIGFEIVKSLCKNFEGIVYLTARKRTRGLEAIHKLKAFDVHPRFFQLDVTNQRSCEKLRDYLKFEHGGLDVLVNNAAVYFHNSSTCSVSSFAKDAEKTIETNYFGVLRVCESLFDLLRPHARVVHMTSKAGHLSWLPYEKLRKEFKKETLTVEKISELMQEFVRNCYWGSNVSEGWGNQPYSISKIGVSALTIAQQKYYDQVNPSIRINCVHPGDVRTQLSNFVGDFSPEEGARTPVFLCILPENERKYRGCFVWYDRKIYDWYGEDPEKNRYTSQKTQTSVSK